MSIRPDWFASSMPPGQSAAAGTTATPAEIHPTLGGIHASVDAQSPRSVASIASIGQLETAIMEAAQLLHRSRHRLLVSLAAYDSDGSWALTGARTCAHWAASAIGVSVGTAREWLRVGHALSRLPEVDDAMARGRLSYCAVRTLTRVAVDHPQSAAELVDLAEQSLPGELGRNLALWARGHDTDDQRNAREREQTYMSWRVEPDGMGTIKLRVPAIVLGRIQAAVDARVMQAKHRDSEDRRPSLGRQRASAVVDLMVGDSSEAPGSPGPVRVDTEVIVHVRADGLSLHDGTPLADTVLAGLVDTAFIRALVHDAEDRPVNASTRRRHPTTRQKRVIDERHQRCAGCGGKELLEYDHDPPYRVSLRTHTDEMNRRCPSCHDRKTRAERSRYRPE